MDRARLVTALSASIFFSGIQVQATLHPQGRGASLAGQWTLNRGLSEFPREIGFNADWMPVGPAGGGLPAGGARGRRGGGGGGGAGPASFPVRESADDAKRLRMLTDEVRSPPAHLTIVEAPGTVTITDDRGQSRVFHTDGRAEVLQIDGTSVGVTAKRDSGPLVIVYSVEQGRELRYSYFMQGDPAQLVVQVQFVERGGGDSVRRVYEPTSATETPAAAPATAAASTSGAPLHDTFDQRPDAELRGLTTLGLVVEDLSAQSTSCGLTQAAIETAVSSRLSDSGFTIRRNSDDDTYVYVNIITTGMTTGYCVSRYDAFLYTHTTAKLSYQDKPVLVQVSLLHKGGIAGGGSAAHAAAVLKGLQEYIDQFAARIRAAGK